MENINKLWLSLLIIFMLAFFNANSQTLNPATLTPHAINIGSTPYKTGSDILDDGTNIYRVSTYDAFTSGVPGFVYTVNGGSTTQIALITYSPSVNYYYNDVCLVQDQTFGTVVALVAYYVYDPIGLSGSWVLQDFFWDGGTNSFLANSVNLLDFGNPGTDVNIDAGDNGNFAIIYDNAGTQISFVTGSVNGYNGASGNLTIDNWGTPNPAPMWGYYPDLCIQNHGGTYEINASCISYPDIQVINYLYNEVATISISTIITKTMSPNNSNFTSNCSAGFGHPRIACPNYTSSSFPEYTVVADEAECNRGRFDIIGSNSILNGSSSTLIPFPYINSSIPCTNPVITYDVGGYVWAGWIIDNTSSALAGPNTTFPIVAACNANGTFNNGYYQVGNNPSSPYKSFGAFSIAAKNATDIFTTYFENNSSPKTLLTKWTPSSTFSNFKVGNTTKQIFLSSLLAGVIPTEYIKQSMTLYLYNTNGQIIINESGDFYRIQNLLKKELTNVPLSLYMVKLITNDGKVILSDKIVCGN